MTKEKDPEQTTPEPANIPAPEKPAAPAKTGKAKTAKPKKPTMAEVQAENARLRKALEDTDGYTDEQTPVPPKWTRAVHEILGQEFECEFAQPDNGGAIFRIIVPRELSNAPQIHWEMHTRDVRSREIGNTGLTGVKEWCLRVRSNLSASGIKLIQYP